MGERKTSFFQEGEEDKKDLGRIREVITRYGRTLRTASERSEVYREAYNAMAQAVLSQRQAGDRHYISYSDKPVERRALESATANSLCRYVGAGKDVLETGCGDGILSISLAAAGNRVLGTDVSDACVESSRRSAAEVAGKGWTVSFERMDAVRFRLDRRFDHVVSSDFLEHLHPDDVREHLASIRGVLKPGGSYVLMTPNRRFGYCEEEMEEDSLHLKEYDLGELTRLLTSNGFGSPCVILASPLTWHLSSRHFLETSPGVACCLDSLSIAGILLAPLFHLPFVRRRLETNASYTSRRGFLRLAGLQHLRVAAPLL